MNQFIQMNFTDFIQPQLFFEDMELNKGFNDNMPDNKNDFGHYSTYNDADHTTNASYMISDREASFEEFLHTDNNKYSRQNSFNNNNENYVGEDGQFIDHHSPMHLAYVDSDFSSVNIKRKNSLQECDLLSDNNVNKKIKPSDKASSSQANMDLLLLTTEKISLMNSTPQWNPLPSDQFFRSEIGFKPLQLSHKNISISDNKGLDHAPLSFNEHEIEAMTDNHNFHKSKKSIIQNYIAATSNGFAKMLSVYGHNKSSEFFSALVASVQTLILEKPEFSTMQIHNIIDLIVSFTKEHIEGKVQKQTHKGKTWSQYKVSNKEEIHQVFHDQIGDDWLQRGIKRILRELIVYFFHSKYYGEWVAEHYRTKKQENKNFFYDKENIEEMVKVYLNPHKCRSHFM